jgi:hypothetical protein
MIWVPNGTPILPKARFRLPFGRNRFRSEPETSKSYHQPSVGKQKLIKVSSWLTFGGLASHWEGFGGPTEGKATKETENITGNTSKACRAGFISRFLDNLLRSLASSRRIALPSSAQARASTQAVWTRSSGVVAGSIARTYCRTVLRLTPNSLAIRRIFHPCFARHGK